MTSRMSLPATSNNSFPLYNAYLAQCAGRTSISIRFNAPMLKCHRVDSMRLFRTSSITFLWWLSAFKKAVQSTSGNFGRSVGGAGFFPLFFFFILFIFFLFFWKWCLYTSLFKKVFPVMGHDSFEGIAVMEHKPCPTHRLMISFSAFGTNMWHWLAMVRNKKTTWYINEWCSNSSSDKCEFLTLLFFDDIFLCNFVRLKIGRVKF